jgi:putative alpha-1,2-mannosidase
MGLFDVKGLTTENPSFQIGSPLFDRIEIKLNNDYYPGKSFVIETKNNSKRNIYSKTESLNNKPFESFFLPFDEVINGGKLVINMSERPYKR